MGKQVMSIGDSVITPFIKFRLPFFYSELNLRILKMKVANKQASSQASGLSLKKAQKKPKQ